jgi:hypothetical protein
VAVETRQEVGRQKLADADPSVREAAVDLLAANPAVANIEPIAKQLSDPYHPLYLAARRALVVREDGGQADDFDRLAKISEYLENEEFHTNGAATFRASSFDGERDKKMDAMNNTAARGITLAEHLLGNQVPETVALARSARELGAAAASAFGAGFGGRVWALVRAESAEEFLGRWQSRYAAAFPEAARGASFLATRPGPSATNLLGRFPTSGFLMTNL